MIDILISLLARRRVKKFAVVKVILENTDLEDTIRNSIAYGWEIGKRALKLGDDLPFEMRSSSENPFIKSNWRDMTMDLTE